MQVRKQNKNSVSVIFSQHEMETIRFLLNRDVGNDFKDIRELVERSLSNLKTYIEHYSEVCEHGYTPG